MFFLPSGFSLKRCQTWGKIHRKPFINQDQTLIHPSWTPCWTRLSFTGTITVSISGVLPGHIMCKLLQQAWGGLHHLTDCLALLPTTHSWSLSLLLLERKKPHLCVTPYSSPAKGVFPPVSPLPDSQVQSRVGSFKPLLQKYPATQHTSCRQLHNQATFVVSGSRQNGQGTTSPHVDLGDLQQMPYPPHLQLPHLYNKETDIYLIGWCVYFVS